MDCAQFRQIVHDLDRAETQGFAIRRNALEHADNCTECNAVLSDVELLESALSRIAVQDSEEHASGRLEAVLLAEFRRHRAVEPAPRRDFSWAALGIAAAFVLMLGIGLHYWMAQQSAKQAEQRDGGATSASTEVASADDDDSAYATDFISLPYADDPETLQDGTIVRVMLSRSALASFGVPVANVQSGAQIPADIALSEDGAPQAIRLVADDDADGGN